MRRKALNRGECPWCAMQVIAHTYAELYGEAVRHMMRGHPRIYIRHGMRYWA